MDGRHDLTHHPRRTGARQHLRPIGGEFLNIYMAMGIDELHGPIKAGLPGHGRRRGSSPHKLSLYTDAPGPT
ncbi:MAG: hypothetical protein Kow0096_20430 [Thiohalomonadaceae bacterium]